MSDNATIMKIAEAMMNEDMQARWIAYRLTGIFPKATHRGDYMGMAKAAIEMYETIKEVGDE